ADLCLVRQVLQHLSNHQIGAVLRKLQQYPLVMITEHYPAPDAAAIVPNKDKAAGADTRITDGSAVFLDRPPFNLAIVQLLVDVETPHWLASPGERLKTFLCERPSPSTMVQT